MANQASRVSDGAAFPELEMRCEVCSGAGTIDREGGQWKICPDCLGGRVVPTPFGKVVLDFLGRHASEISGS